MSTLFLRGFLGINGGHVGALQPQDIKQSYPSALLPRGPVRTIIGLLLYQYWLYKITLSVIVKLFLSAIIPPSQHTISTPMGRYVGPPYFKMPHVFKLTLSTFETAPPFITRPEAELLIKLRQGTAKIVSWDEIIELILSKDYLYALYSQIKSI